MKHYYMLGLAMAGLLSLPSYGQGGVHQFPKPFTPATAFAAPAWAPETPSLVPSAIDDKSEGVTIYAGQRMDQSKLRSLVKIKTGDASNFERIKTYLWKGDEGIGSQQYGLTCGASDGKDYYGVFSYDYTYSTQGRFFSKLDMVTGDTTVVRAYTTEEQNAWYGDGVYGAKRNGLYDMSYDPSTDTYFALGYGWNDDGSVGHTVLYTVDIATGATDVVMDFQEILYEFCFDAFGNMYATRPKAGGTNNEENVGTELVKYDSNFQELSAVEVKSNWGEALKMVQFGALSIDNNTGTIYWLPALEYGAITLYTVDQKTGVATGAGWFMTGNWFCGLYIPYLAADNAKAAGRVASLNVTPSATGGALATLSWTNPTKAWDGTELTEMKEVRIYRKKAGAVTNDRTTSAELLSSAVSELVATVPADGKVGEAMEYVDNSAKAGINTYYVVPSRVSGELGVPDSIRCFVGGDVPGEVLNASVERKGEGLKVSWQAPENGVNKGYIETSELKYKLTRMPDNVVVAENLTETEFLDNTLGEQQKYYYLIQASTNAGAGAVLKTDAVMAGSALQTPINLKFETEDDAARWTSDPYSSILFYYGGGNSDEYKSMVGYGNNYEAEGRLFSPPLKLEKGKTYRIVSDLYENEMNCSYDLKITMGKSNESIDGAEVLRDDKAIECAGYTREQFEDMFTAPETGTYYYALTVATHQEYNVFRFYGLTVDYVCENDLKAVSMGNIIEAVANSDNNTCKVQVRNMGSKDQSNYTVNIYCNDEGNKVLVGSTSDVPTLKAGKSADVTCHFKPLAEGKFNFYAEVVLDGDEDLTNNVTPEISLNVLEEGSAAWTNIVTSKKDEGNDTHGPIVYYSTYDRSETIYYASEIKADAGSWIKRIAYIYSSNDNLTDRTDESNVKIYMGYTDLKSYSSVADALDPASLTLVYDGTMYLEPGTDKLLAFTLDTPFEYDNTKNLVVVFEREGSVANEHMFGAVFKVFGNNWSSGVYRKLEYKGSAEFSGTYDNKYPSAPIIYLAMENSATGITTTKALNGTFSYDCNSGVMSFGVAAKSVAVYSLDGMLVKNVKVVGNAATLNLAKGLYVVRVTTAEGKSEAAKLSVVK